jgi:hypothetical protein
LSSGSTQEPWLLCAPAQPGSFFDEMKPSQQTCEPLHDAALRTVPPPLPHAVLLATQVDPVDVQTGLPGLGSFTRRGSQTHLPAAAPDPEGMRQSSWGNAHGFVFVLHATSFESSWTFRPGSQVAILDEPALRASAAPEPVPSAVESSPWLAHPASPPKRQATSVVQIRANRVESMSLAGQHRPCRRAVS